MEHRIENEPGPQSPASWWATAPSMSLAFSPSTPATSRASQTPRRHWARRVWRRLTATAACLFGLLAAPAAYADTVVDWGAIPIGSDLSFSIGPMVMTSNYTDKYVFSLTGATAVAYSTDSFIAACSEGCGNPKVSFGLYGGNGAMIDSSGATVLDSGDYVFQVKGTGMGSGNSFTREGVVSFQSSIGTAQASVAAALAYGDTAMVSPTPEPEMALLLLIGLVMMQWTLRRRAAAPLAV